MKTIKIMMDGSEVCFTGDKLIKTDDSLILMNGETVVFSAKGVTNFSGYTIVGEPDKTEIQILQETVEQLLLLSLGV